MARHPRPRLSPCPTAVLTAVLLSLGAAGAWAGDLDASAAPSSSSSAMYTLTDLYNRIDKGTAATKRQGAFTEPTAAPTGTGKTLNDLYDLASQRSRPARTGQTTCYDTSSNTAKTCDASTAGQDGALQKGVAVTSPNPRFTANVDKNNDGDCTDAGETCDGTVTDNLTGLIWLWNANCFSSIDWASALAAANSLANGSCGLTDGSQAGAWRLPNIRELLSLVGFSTASPGPVLPIGHPFSGVQSHVYWSSTSLAGNPSSAWYLGLNVGNVSYVGKSYSYYVWPVRGGQ